MEIIQKQTTLINFELFEIKNSRNFFTSLVHNWVSTVSVTNFTGARITMNTNVVHCKHFIIINFVLYHKNVGPVDFCLPNRHTFM